MVDTAKTAIVTGASRGIGAAIARRLARDGFAVAVNYAGNEAAAREVVDEIQAAGGRAAAIRADVTDPADVAQLFDAAEAAFGPVGLLVNNAGIMHLSPIAETDDATLEAHIATNLKGAFHALREAARRMGPGGRIVNLSSSVVATSLPGYGIYAATKGAVEALSRVLAKEMRGRRITVNTVAPGPVGTELFFYGKTDEQVAGIARLSPMERIGEPAEIADAVAFLAGPDGRWVNGQVLRVNGGMV